MRRDLLHIKAIVCNVLRREFMLCAARSPNIVDMVFLPQGLHDQPDFLREAVQKEINASPPERQGVRKDRCPVPVDADSPYDAVVLGYALCSNATAGLKAGTCPLVTPRAHDCISLLLGSSRKYREYFDAHPGTYWYSSGWIETCPMPGRERYEEALKHFTEKYGEDNARYLMEMEADWFTSYSQATYIDWDWPNADSEKAFTRQCADYLKWEYDQVEGTPDFLQRLVDGKWDDNDFVVVQPGEMLESDAGSDGIIKAVKAAEGKTVD